MRSLLLLLLLIKTFVHASDTIVAKIEGKDIFASEIEEAFKKFWEEVIHFNNKKPSKEDKRFFALNYIKFEILKEIAEDMNVKVSDNEVDKKLKTWGVMKKTPIMRELALRELIVEKLLKKVTVNINVSDEEIKAYYMLNRREFFLPNRVKLLRVVAYDKKTAWKVYRLLRKGKKIEGLENVSVGKERWYSIQALPKKVRRKIYPYKVGSVSKPIKVRDSYLILKITDKKKAGYMSFEEAKPIVMRKILKKKKEEVFQRWFLEVSKDYIDFINLEYFLR